MSSPLSRLNPDAVEAFLKKRAPMDLDRPRSLSGAHLERALEALHDAGNPDVLFGAERTHPWTADDKLRSLLLAQAEHRRLSALSSAVLFAAFAAEAYINEYIAAMTKGYRARDRDMLDQLRTIPKYLLVPKMVGAAHVFEPGKPPVSHLEELFALRNKLAHPKPGFGPGLLYEKPGKFEQAFSAARIAEQIIHVSAAALVLVRQAFDEKFDVPADMIWFGRTPILAYGEKAMKLPAMDAEPERPLFAQAFDFMLDKGKTTED